MRQGIILTIVIWIISISLLGFGINSNLTVTGEEVVLKQNGQELLKTKLTDELNVFWYLKQANETLVLRNQEIIDYFELELSVEDLTNKSLLDVKGIYEKIGSNSELNMIEISNKTAFFYEANCSNYLCVLAGKISKTNQTVVCAPHKLSLTIIGGESEIDVQS